MADDFKSWLITIPKTIPWSTYEQELAQVEWGDQEMNYRTRYIPKEMRVGDRCYVVHDGVVRGWMSIVGLGDRPSPWGCSTTGEIWSPGKYIQRSGFSIRWTRSPTRVFVGFARLKPDYQIY